MIERCGQLFNFSYIEIEDKPERGRQRKKIGEKVYYSILMLEIM